MEGIWNIYLDEKVVGTCRIWREGLYSHISCRCAKAAEGICRLVMECGDVAMDLGILVPVEGGFGLERKFPAKKLPEGQPRFFVTGPGRQKDEAFLPVREGEVFLQLSRLRDARFARRGGEVGVILK